MAKKAAGPKAKAKAKCKASATKAGPKAKAKRKAAATKAGPKAKAKRKAAATNAGPKAKAKLKAAATKAGPKAKAKRKATATNAGPKAKAKLKAAATKAGPEAKFKAKAKCKAAAVQSAAQLAEDDSEPWDLFFGRHDVFRPRGDAYSTKLYFLMKHLFFANLEVKQFTNPTAAVSGTSGLKQAFSRFMAVKTLFIELEPASSHRNMLEDAARDWAQFTLADDEAMVNRLQTEWLGGLSDQQIAYHLPLELGHVDVPDVQLLNQRWYPAEI